MITASFIWLILSHIAVFIPLVIGYKTNKRRWLACSIVLSLTAFFSSIYHWHEMPYSEEFIVLGTGYSIHKSIDLFCSYLSIFLVVFYGINPREKPEHIDITLMIIVIICHILTLINIEWYYFCIIVSIFCLIYKLLCIRTKWMLLIRNIFNNFLLFMMGIISFSLAMVIQYYFCVLYPNGLYYHIYHGFWHFFMFLSAGLWMKWNGKMILNQVPANNIIDNQNIDSNLDIENI